MTQMLRPVSQSTGIFHAYSPIRKGVGRCHECADTEMLRIYSLQPLWAERSLLG